MNMFSKTQISRGFSGNPSNKKIAFLIASTMWQMVNGTPEAPQLIIRNHQVMINFIELENTWKRH